MTQDEILKIFEELVDEVKRNNKVFEQETKTNAKFISDQTKELQKHYKRSMDAEQKFRNRLAAETQKKEDIKRKKANAMEEAQAGYKELLSGNKGGFSLIKSGIMSYVKTVPVLGSVTLALQGFYEAVKATVSYLASTATVMNSLRISGIQFSGSIEQLREAQYKSLLTMEEFTKILAAATESVAALGSKGTERFTETVGNMSRNLAGLGLTMEDYGSILRDVTEAERLGGFIGKVNDQQRQAAAITYTKELLQFGVLMGVGRKRLEDFNREAMQSVGVSGFLAQLSPQNAAAARESLNRIYSAIAATFGEASKDTADTFTSILTQSYKNSPMIAYMETVIPGFMSTSRDLIEKMRNGIKISQEETVDMLKNFRSSAANISSEQIRTLTTLADGGNKEASMLIRVINQFRNLSDENFKKMLEAQETSPLVKLLTSFDQLVYRPVYNKFMEVVNKIIGEITPNEDMIKRFTNFLISLVDSFETGANRIINWMKLEPEQRESFINMIGKFFTDLFGPASPFGKQVVEPIANWIADLFQKLISRTWDILWEKVWGKSERAPNPRSGIGRNPQLAPSIPDRSLEIPISPFAEGGIARYSPNRINTVAEKPGQSEAVIPLNSGEQIPIARIDSPKMLESLEKLVGLNKEVIQRLDIFIRISSRGVKNMEDMTDAIENQGFI